MSTAIVESIAGWPVEIGRIDRELGKLWEASDDTKMRASLINLAIYSEDASSVAANTAIVSEVAGQHACRALLIFADPAAPVADARAWINAHCHMVGKSGRQICSEQITFQLDGSASQALPNIVFSHLDSDLPLCFWWQGDFHDRWENELWSWVDRLIFDSSTWQHPARQFAITRDIAASASDNALVLCDLNWTRLYNCRFALASIFDHAGAMACLPAIDSVMIACAPGSRTTALLLLGWLASQLDWKLESLLGRDFFTTRDGRQIGFQIREEPGATISHVSLCAGGSCVELRRAEGSEFFHGRVHAACGHEALPTLSAGREKIVDILLAELSRGGRHPLYARSVARVLPLLAGG